MNRTVLIGALVVVLAIAGYYTFGGNDVDATTDAATTTGTATTDTATTGTAATGTATTDSAAPAATATTDTTAPAATDTTATTTETAPAATTDTTATTTEAAPATDTATAAPAAGDATAALDPANFDADAVKKLINDSQLADAAKAPLISSVDAAAADPALVESTLTTVRAALGL